MRIMNSKVHESTGFSPAQLVFPGIDLDRRILTADTSIVSQNLSTFTSRLLLMQDTVVAVAQMQSI